MSRHAWTHAAREADLARQPSAGTPTLLMRAGLRDPPHRLRDGDIRCVAAASRPACCVSCMSCLGQPTSRCRENRKDCMPRPGSGSSLGSMTTGSLCKPDSNSCEHDLWMTSDRRRCVNRERGPTGEDQSGPGRRRRRPRLPAVQGPRAKRPDGRQHRQMLAHHRPLAPCLRLHLRREACRAVCVEPQSARPGTVVRISKASGICPACYAGVMPVRAGAHARKEFSAVGTDLR